MLNSPTCYSGHQNGERIERFSRKVFVGGLPPDIDEGELEANEVWREGKREKTKWINESNPPSKIMLYNRLQLASSCFVFNEMSMLMGMLRLVSLDVIHSFWFWEVLFISDSTLADCRVPYDAWNLLLMLTLQWYEECIYLSYTAEPFIASSTSTFSSIHRKCLLVIEFQTLFYLSISEVV